MIANKKRKLSKSAPAPSVPKLRSPSPEVTPPAHIEDEVQPKSFQDLGVIDSLCEACTALGYKSPTPIQVEAIPLALQGRDLIGKLSYDIVEAVEPCEVF